MKRIGGWFLTGLAVLLPTVITVYVVYEVVTRIDRLLPIRWTNAEGEQITVPGLGFVMTIVGITVVGILASNVLGRALVRLLERTFERLPFVKLLFKSVRDVIGSFVGDKKSFDKPVLVRLTRDGSARIMGFVTRESLGFLGLEDHVAVYFPQSYNFAGNLVLFPADQVERVDVASSEVMTFLVSGGVSGKAP